MLRLQLKRQLADFTLDIDVECRYPVTAIFGPSGSGKTSLLNAVAGLLKPDAGEIAIDDTPLFSSANNIDLAPEKRGVGYVFQNDLLFPHLSVEENLRYGHDLLPAVARRFAPAQIVELLEIGTLLARRPGNLSGGERQRVALGRALLSSPQLLLMDEPLAALDQGLKSRIIPYLRHIRDELTIPILYVSHSVAEILELTGQVLVLDRGRAVAHGDFFRIAHEPQVLPLIEDGGFENVLDVELVSGDPGAGITLARAEGQELKIPYCDRPAGSRLFAGIRSDDIILARERVEGLSARNTLEGHIIEVSDVASKELVYVDVGRRLAVKVTPEAIAALGLQTGDRVYCLIKTHSIRIGPEME